MSTYNGWTVVTMPTVPAAPASIEFQKNSLTATSTNPFTGAQIVHSWGASYFDASVSMPTMAATTAQAWLTFLESCNGPACVFTFHTSVCAMYLNELTLTGDTGSPRYWRLKSGQNKWSISKGNVYAITFEVREAI